MRAKRTPFYSMLEDFHLHWTFTSPVFNQACNYEERESQYKKGKVKTDVRGARKQLLVSMRLSRRALEDWLGTDMSTSSVSCRPFQYVHCSLLVPKMATAVLRQGGWSNFTGISSFVHLGAISEMLTLPEQNQTITCARVVHRTAIESQRPNNLSSSRCFVLFFSSGIQ